MNTVQLTLLTINILLPLGLIMLPIFFSQNSKFTRFIRNIQPHASLIFLIQFFNLIFYYSHSSSTLVFSLLSLFLLTSLVIVVLDTFLPIKIHNVTVDNINYLVVKGSRICVLRTNMGIFRIGDMWGNYDTNIDILTDNTKQLVIETTSLLKRVLEIRSTTNKNYIKKNTNVVLNAKELNKYRSSLIQSLIVWTIVIHLFVWLLVLFDYRNLKNITLDDILVLETIPILFLIPMILLSYRNYVIIRRSAGVNR